MPVRTHHPSSRPSFRAISSLMVAIVLGPTAAGAATLTVNTLVGTSTEECTLEDAIFSANFNTNWGSCIGIDPYGDDTIQFSVTGTIELTQALPSLTSNITIDGPGATDLEVRRLSGGDYRIFGIQSTRVVSISGLTLSNGRLTTFTQTGAGIVNEGTLTLEDTIVTDNHVVITDSSGPSTGFVGAGGGISNSGTLTLRHSTVSGNSIDATQTGPTNTSVDAHGGGIYNGGTLTVERSTVSGNTSAATNTSIDPNASALATGGGIELRGGTATIRLSTVSGNEAIATSANNPTERGGGISSFLGTLTATSDTVAFNTGASGANLWAQGTETFTNVILSDPQEGPNCQDTVNTDGGFNLVFPAGCGLAGISADPLLQPLADNGPPTQTHGLAAASPAIDAGTSAGDVTDQRGLTRPQDFPAVANAASGDGTDIGAFELQTLDLEPPVTTIDTGPTGTVAVGAATFTFSSDEPGSTFECQLDGAGFTGCSSPKSYAGLADGSHTFQVRAIDPAGNVDLDPATTNWTVADPPETTIVTAPAGIVESAGASFAFSSDEVGSTFECQLDGGTFTACATPKSYSGLADGDHSLAVRAVDPAGNLDASPAVASWTVRLIDPRCVNPGVICGTSGPDNLVGTNGNDLILGGGGNDICNGAGGNDVINCGAGNDTILGGRGNDVLRSTSGNDTIRGGPGRDRLYGGAGRDRLFGGGGRDRLFGQGGPDRLNGGAGLDRCSGGAGLDWLLGCEA